MPDDQLPPLPRSLDAADGRREPCRRREPDTGLPAHLSDARLALCDLAWTAIGGQRSRAVDDAVAWASAALDDADWRRLQTAASARQLARSLYDELRLARHAVDLLEVTSQARQGDADPRALAQEALDRAMALAAEVADLGRSALT